MVNLARPANEPSDLPEWWRRYGKGAAGIAAALRRAILDGHYEYNQRLPAERDLADEFGAARGTVREALRQLEEIQLVQRKVGSGTFVRYGREFDSSDVAEVTGPLELIDVRLAVEPAVARLAVVNAHALNIRQLADALVAAESAHGDANLFSEGDEKFHLALAECTQNPLLAWIYRAINDVRGHHQWSARKDKILTARRIDGYNSQHREIFNAVDSRDADRAVESITRHLQDARRDLLGESAS